MKREKPNTVCAGIDVAKLMLDVAVHRHEPQIRAANDPAGYGELIAWLRGLEVTRVGLEASGGYERGLVAALRAADFEVVIHQPTEIRAFARFKRIRAKNDKLDARVIAMATAQVEAVKAASDPRLAELAEWMTAYDQASARLAEMKTCLEQVAVGELRKGQEEQIQHARLWKQALARNILKRIRAHADLLRRYELLRSLVGFGPIVAAQILVRMPELGALPRGRAASLVGVAPFDKDTGQSHGQRHIKDGRSRPRRYLYIAALAAKRVDPQLRALAARLLANGKPPKVAIVAVMRKLIEAANIVLARDAPWTAQPAS